MIITVAHTKGGVGKSLIAWNLAIAMKARVVDLDFQQTLLFANSIREQYRYKPISVEHFDALESFFEFHESLEDDECVIIDVGGFDSDLTRMALYVADIIITPASDRLTELTGLMKFNEIIKEVSEDTESNLTSHILINNVSPNARDFAIITDFVSENDNFKMVETIIHQRADYYKCLAEGKSVVELKNSKAKQEIQSLVKEIRKVLNG